MSDFLKAVKVTEKVYWVGAIDWNIRNFHGYATNFGSTYNAFLVLDKKITLIDTVKAPFFSEMMERISSVIDPEKIDYIVSNHAEMDHSGALTKTLEAIKPEKLFASPMGEKALKLHFGDDLPITVVNTGEKISLGENNLIFAETKMLHWPDSMVSFLDGEKILFSQDAFGMHLAGSRRFHNDYDVNTLTVEAKKYFANILMLQAPKVLSLLDTLPSFNFDIKMIAPDHGPIWRNAEGIDFILKLYRKMAEQKPAKRAVVIYDTMWGSTAAMAKSVADGIAASGVDCDLICLGTSDRSNAMTKVLDAGIVAVGSPTLNNNLFPTVADFLCYFKGLRPQNLIGGAFGSFGWSGEAAKQIAETLTACKVQQPCEPLNIKYVPDREELAACFQFGERLAATLIAEMKK